jgi:hypothetical protein
MKNITKIIKRLEELRKQGYDCEDQIDDFNYSGNNAYGMNLYVYKIATLDKNQIEEGEKING